MIIADKSNDYSPGMKRLPEERLREYIQHSSDFHDEAILAAIWELSRRRDLLEDESLLENEILQRSEESQKTITILSHPVAKIISTPLPSLYSIRAIQVFSVLFSIIAGGILMAINFNRTKQKNEVYKVLGFSLLYTISSMLILMVTGIQSAIVSLILNLSGAFLIEQLFWKRVLGAEFRYNKQEVWTAVAVALLVISPLLWYAAKSGILQNL